MPIYFEDFFTDLPGLQWARAEDWDGDIYVEANSPGAGMAADLAFKGEITAPAHNIHGVVNPHIVGNFKFRVCKVEGHFAAILEASRPGADISGYAHAHLAIKANLPVRDVEARSTWASNLVVEANFPPFVVAASGYPNGIIGVNAALPGSRVNAVVYAVKGAAVESNLPGFNVDAVVYSAGKHIGTILSYKR